MGSPSDAIGRMTRTVAIAGSIPEPIAVPVGDDGPPALAHPSLASMLHLDGVPDGTETRYELGEMLGAGGNGRIYSVRDRDLDRPVALKYLARQADDRDSLKAFLNEARITASLQHPNVLPVHEIAVDQRGQVYFTMKRIEGRSLADAIDASTPASRNEHISNIGRMVSIAIDVCSALAYAHHHRIVHQDVKPANIMLGTFGEVLLIDWGSAILLDTTKPGEHLYGTPLYMSPEQARRSHADERSDVYCLGGTLLHMLTLRYPLMADDENELWRKKRDGLIDAPSPDERAGIPPALMAITLRALASAPEARYANAKAMLDDLEAYQAGLAVSARSDTLLDRCRRWYRHNARLFWVSAALLAVIAAVSGAFLVEKSKERADWHVVYTEDFSHATPKSIAASWMGMTGYPGDTAFVELPLDSQRLSIEDGHVRLLGGHGYTDLTYRGDLTGDVRVEWEYTSPVSKLDLNCFIGGHDRLSGYTFHIGSWSNSAYVSLTTMPKYAILDCDYLAHPLEAGHPYRFAMEKEGSRLRLRIDGTTIFDDENPAMAYGDASSAFGFDCVENSEVIISHVRVSHKPMPQRISPIAVADKLMQIRDYARAESQYQDIGMAYSGTDLARVASFRMAVCALRSGAVDRGATQLASFVQDRPRDQLTPYALYELLQVSRERHDDAEAARLREALVQWRGHAILQRVIAQLADAHLSELENVESGGVREPLHPAGVVERIHATLDELHLWGDRYGTAWWKNTYVFTSPGVLEDLGLFRDIVERYPPRSTTVGIALIKMGKYDEALARFAHDPLVKGVALMDLGRGDESPDSYGYLQVLMDRGEYAAVLANPGAHGEFRAHALVLAGRYEEVLASYRYSIWECADALIALGRPAEIGTLEPGNGLQAVMLVETGRLDEVVEKYPHEYPALYRVVLHRLVAGDTVRARALLDDLDAAKVPEGNEYLMFERDIFPSALRMITGETSDGPGAFAKTLATPFRCRQRMWHLASFIAGTIDEPAFEAQPYRYLAKERLLFARALRADCHHQRDEASRDYLAYSRLPCFRSYANTFEREFVRWRIDALSKE